MKVTYNDWGHLVDNHGMSYIISNLPKVATWRSKGFRIGPLIAEKSTTLLFTGTLGHTVANGGTRTQDPRVGNQLPRPLGHAIYICVPCWCLYTN